jgi:hypothetical protein
MELRCQADVQNTRMKIERLERLCSQAGAEEADPGLRRMTLRSLREAIRQMKEDIIRYHSRARRMAS